jgi:hypothetical protein
MSDPAETWTTVSRPPKLTAYHARPKSSGIKDSPRKKVAVAAMIFPSATCNPAQAEPRAAEPTKDPAVGTSLLASLTADDRTAAEIPADESPP